MSRAEEQMNLGEQCPVLAQMSPPECRHGKDPLAHPAHGCQASGRSVLALYFLCFVQSKLSQSIEFLSLPRGFILQETGAGLSFLVLSLGLAV